MIASQVEGGGGGPAPTMEMPKAVLGVDPFTGNLIVTGPHHIFLAIESIVKTLDQPEPPQYVERMPIEVPINGDALAKQLKTIVGAKLVYSGDESTETLGNAGEGNGEAGEEVEINPGGMNEQQINQIRRQFQQQMRQQGGGRGGQGGGRGGGGGLGGRGRGGR